MLAFCDTCNFIYKCYSVYWLACDCVVTAPVFASGSWPWSCTESVVSAVKCSCLCGFAVNLLTCPVTWCLFLPWVCEICALHHGKCATITAMNSLLLFLSCAFDHWLIMRCLQLHWRLKERSIGIGMVQSLLYRSIQDVHCFCHLPRCINKSTTRYAPYWTVFLASFCLCY